MNIWAIAWLVAVVAWAIAVLSWFRLYRLNKLLILTNDELIEEGRELREGVDRFQRLLDQVVESRSRATIDWNS